MIMTFDTESTGLPKDWKASMKDLDNWPRVIQLAWSISDYEGKVLKEKEYLIKPDGWNVPDLEYFIGLGYEEKAAAVKAKFWIDNNFSQKGNIEKGVEMNKVLNEIILDMLSCTHLAAHNMSFDHNVLGAEFLRNNKSLGKKLKKLCTKELSTDYCKIKGSYGKYKWPSLPELFFKLFKKEFLDGHDALIDVRGCRDCLYELMRLKVIKL